MPGRLRRREAGLRVCIRKAELAGLGYRESVRPLLVELRDCIARRNAPEAAGGAIPSPALSVYAETLKTPQGPKMGLVGQTVKGTLK